MPEDADPTAEDPTDVQDDEIDEGTRTLCGRRWNPAWIFCRGRAKWTPKAIFCEANQLLEFCTCLDFNDYDLFSMPERLMLLLFDMAFVWVTVVLGHMSQLQGVAGREDASLSDESLDAEASCDFQECVSVVKAVLAVFVCCCASHVSGIFGLLGNAFDVKGGFLVMEILAAAILSLGFGKVPMEHIMINAIPELPKWDPFYWKDALDICGLVVGAPAQSISTTCCQGCCVPGQSSTCGNGQFTIRNACFLYCACMCGWAVIMMLYVIRFAHMCVLPFLFEMMVLMMVTWTLIYPFEASFLACLGFGVDTQASHLEGGLEGAANRFNSDVDDEEGQATSRGRFQKPEPMEMQIVE